MNFKPSSPRLVPKTGTPENKSTPADGPTESQTSGSQSAESQSAKSQSAKSQTSEVGTPTQQSDPVTEELGLPPDQLSLDNAMRADRVRLRRQRKRLSKNVFERQLAQSIHCRRRREGFRPRLECPSELPISQYRDEIVELLRTRQVLVVCGETGSGKSTQLPKFCLEAGYGRSAMIGHTQPRRLAARSIATRLAEEMECKLGKEVGYQVRFGDETSDETMVKLMTDGVLLAETGSDRDLDQYDVIIIDEAHERSLNIDFLLAYLRGLQAKRPELRIIITSATIDAERFAEHFADEDGPAPILTVEGRGYPVEIRYLGWEDVDPGESRGYDLAMHVIAGVQDLSRTGAGDTLVFLPTERDIRLVSHRVAGHFKRMGLQQRVEILPLYARLPQKDQQLIFNPTGQKQRLIFATNVAESSLTVPGIRYVIDAGTARISRYSPRSKLQRLPIEAVSKASADQRAGRCGRVGPGICIRLYSAEDYESRDDYTTPEIRRTNLASVVLQSKMLGFGSLESLPLLDMPRPESIREGVQTLWELGAIDEQQELTTIGQRLGRMPVDPRIGRIILAGDEFGVLPEILPIAAAMEIPDPRQRPPDQQQAADESHSEFVDRESDFLSFLRLWRYYENARQEFSRSKLTRVLRKRFLSPTRMREWSDTYRQLREIACEIDRTTDRRKPRTRRKIGAPRLADEFEKCTLDKDRYESVHQALLTGFLSGVAMAGEKNIYIGPRNLKLFLWPGSGVFDAKPKWIVAAELVETAKQYARTVARIQPQWIEQVGDHLLKDSYGDPHWSRKSSGAFCYQRRSLFGLPVVVRRRVPLSPIDPSTARDLLIQHGLVEQELVTNALFVRHNRNLRELVESLAAKTRRRDLVVDEYLIAQFYQQRLPEDVTDKGRLEKFARTHPKPDWLDQLQNASQLSQWLTDPPDHQAEEAGCYLHPENLLDCETQIIAQEDFPDELKVGGTKLPLEYRYVPGADDDGISLKIHQSAVTQVSDDRLGWLVPGLLHAKIVAMIKSLPKRIRRNLVPAADVAHKIAEELSPQFGAVPFMPAVCECMSRYAEMRVGPSDFQQEKLDQYLEFFVHVVDDEGGTLAKGRSINQLRERVPSGHEPEDAGDNAETDSQWGCDQMTDFVIDELPRQVIRTRGGVQVAQFPGLVDHGDSVSTRLMPDLAAAEASLRQGTTRLFAIAEKTELRRQVRWLPGLDQTKVRLSGAVKASLLETSLMDLLARIAFVENQPVVRTKSDFQTRREDRGEKISVAVQQAATWLAKLGEEYLRMRGKLESASSKDQRAVADVRQQVSWLMHDQFLSATPWQWLNQYPRYLSAMSYRLEKLQSGAADRDRSATDLVAELWGRWIEMLPEEQQSPLRQSSSEFRWMIEELRVSLFAQPLGTSMKVSPKRCEKWLDNFKIDSE